MPARHRHCTFVRTYQLRTEVMDSKQQAHVGIVKDNANPSDPATFVPYGAPATMDPWRPAATRRTSAS